jgi:hypothetical protein
MQIVKLRSSAKKEKLAEKKERRVEQGEAEEGRESGTGSEAKSEE